MNYITLQYDSPVVKRWAIQDNSHPAIYNSQPVHWSVNKGIRCAP
jgi:hypothetical protein